MALLTLPLVAQQKPKVAAQLTLKDPDLYCAFFKAHAFTDVKIQSSSPATAAQLSSATAALYSLNQTDLAALTTEVRKFNTSMGAWLSQEQYYVAQQQAAKKPVDVKTLVRFQRQRQRLVINTHGAVHRALSAPGWAALDGYVKGNFKVSVNSVPGGSK